LPFPFLGFVDVYMTGFASSVLFLPLGEILCTYGEENLLFLFFYGILKKTNEQEKKA